LDISKVIETLFGVAYQKPDLIPVGGGCIHQTGRFDHSGKSYFLKWSSRAGKMFETEEKGLKMLEMANDIVVPQVVGRGNVGGTDFLCLEFVSSGSVTSEFWKSFGRQLASLHRHTQAHFGLSHDNFIGRLSQPNKVNPDWVNFFITCRLVPQLEMAYANGLIGKEVVHQFDKLIAKLDQLMPLEEPALLHGDLWSGNFIANQYGRAVVFDPAVYYGHREAEIAFTKLFGGFDNSFHKAYQEIFPLQSGHIEREGLFNLYPLLVHINLFGASYLTGVLQTLKRFT
jgi:fructosamine-3-kinase